MSKTDKLDQQINSLQVELHAAKAAKTQIGEKLAIDPTNTELITSARDVSAQVQGLTTDIEILEGAREAASAADLRAAEEAGRDNALRNLANIEKLLAQRVKAAKQIDEALARLRQVNKNWLAVNGECASTIEAFKRYVYGSGAITSGDGVRSMSNDVVNAIADNFAESMKGFECYQVMSFNHLRHNAHETESAAIDAGKSSERLLQSVRGIAVNKGLV